MFIGYVRVPYFSIAVARRDDPVLVGRPLMLVEEASQATVYAASEEASSCGVRPGMSLPQAQRLCPEARLAPAAESAYLSVFETCLQMLELFTPKVEPEGLGSAYLDLDDTVRDPDEGADLCRKLAKQLRHDQALTASMGITTTMFGAAVAGSHIRPGLALALPSGMERDFLASFPAGILPVSDEMVRRLQLLGLRRVGQYADLPSSVILNQFGWEGQRAHRLARGRDDRRVNPCRPRLIEIAEHYFEDPTKDMTLLAAVRDRLVGRLLERLRERYLAPQAMHLRVSFEAGSSREVRTTFTSPTMDEERLRRTAERLTRSLSRGSTLQQHRSRVTEVEIGLGKLGSLIGRQLSLFPTQAGRERQLRQTLANLAHRYGNNGFQQPQVVDPDSLVLERRFALYQWKHE